MISSQEVHARFGGVVPEIAARHHLELIDAVVAEAFARAGAELDDVTLVAATRGPGLVGALLVGFSAAKAIAAARELPFAARRPPRTATSPPRTSRRRASSRRSSR